MSEPPSRYGDSRRGVSYSDVSTAADALLRAGERPTVRKVRAQLGSGSPNTINPLLDQWWKRQAGRLDNGPAAFHRLPEVVAHIAEALWLKAMDEARGRVLLEQAVEKRGAEQDKERVELKSHLLSLRESEMEQRIKDRDKQIGDLETRLQLVTTALTREQANRNVILRKITALEAVLPPVPKKRSASKPKLRKKTKRAVRSRRRTPKKVVTRRTRAARKSTRR